jgi:hypothetical protein
MVDILRRVTTIVGRDRKEGTRGADGVGSQPDLAGKPNGKKTPENKRIAARQPETYPHPRTPDDIFFGRG